MCAADRNLLTGGQSNFCMLEFGNCMKVHKETSVAAHEKIRQLLLENIQFVTDCIGFSLKGVLMNTGYVRTVQHLVW